MGTGVGSGLFPWGTLALGVGVEGCSSCCILLRYPITCLLTIHNGTTVGANIRVSREGVEKRLGGTLVK